MPTPTQTRDNNSLREPRSYGTATKSTGPEIPDVEDGEHPANIKNVQEGTSNYNGEERDQFVVEFELLDIRRGDGSFQTLRSWITIPPTLVSDGKLNENSTLYAFLTALYGELDDEIVIEPLEWIGNELRVIVENKTITEGQNKGQTRPRIVKYMRKKTQRSAPVASKSQAARPAPAEEPDDDF